MDVNFFKDPSFLPQSLEKILLENQIVSQSQLNWAKFKQAQTGERIEVILLKEGIIDEKALAICYALQHNIEFIDDDIKIEEEALKTVPKDILEEYEFIPISKTDNSLKIAVSSPYQHELIEDLKRLTQLEVKPVIVEKNKLQKRRQEIFEQSDTPSKIQGAGHILDSIFLYAWENYASDIHFIFEEDGLQIKYRIAGDLKSGPKIETKDAEFLMVRLKILSNLDITEHFIPQEGQFVKKITSKNVNFRVSILPSYFGENAVVRLLNKRNFEFSLENIGLDDYQKSMLKEILFLKKGLILIGGPTGSGKTTTLYSALEFLKKEFPNKKIMTIEDPIEYPLSGISQTKVTYDEENTKKLTFTRGLRAILRQDPDIIMIGEIREKEAAMIAVNAAITGHLVLASIHASNVFEIINRMRYFEVPDHLLLESTKLLISQVIYKKICQNCKIPVERFGLKGFVSKGCEKCGNNGFSERIGVFEFLTLNKKIRTLISNTKLLSVIEDEVKKLGFVSLKDKLAEKLDKGFISVDEYHELSGGSFDI